MASAKTMTPNNNGVSTSVIIAGTIYTNKTVEFNPSQPTIHLVVTAKDHGIPSLTAVIAVRVQVIDINNHAPVFLQSIYT